MIVREDRRMGMRYEPYERRHLKGIVDAFNTMTQGDAYIASLTENNFVSLVEDKTYFDPQGLIVALNGSHVAGWIHACVAGGTETYHQGDETAAHLRMLVFDRREIALGVELVYKGTQWLTGKSHKCIHAMDARMGYPFYRGIWMGSEPMGSWTHPHVQAALAVAGFQFLRHDVFMAAQLNERGQVLNAREDVTYQSSLQGMKHAAMTESWRGLQPRLIQARVGTQEAGYVGWVMLPKLERLGHPCMSIYDFSVDNAFRRRGIGTSLLTMALREGYDAGAREACLITPIESTPAHETYRKCGFSPRGLMTGRYLEVKD